MGGDTVNITTVIIWLLVFISSGCLAYQIFSMFSVSYADIQRQGQTPEQTETPMSYFISKEALRSMQIWLGAAVFVAGLFFTGLSRNWMMLIPVVLVAVVIVLVPPIYYAYKVRKRREDFESGMLSFVMQLTNALRAGIAVQSAIGVTCQSVGGSLGEEFSRAMKEHGLGLSLSEALERINQRIDSENLKLFVATVSQAQTAGGDIADVLENIVKTIRMRKEFEEKLEIKINKYNGIAKQILLLSILLILGFFILLKQLFLPMLSEPLGWIIFFVITIIMIISFCWIKYITTVEI